MRRFCSNLVVLALTLGSTAAHAQTNEADTATALAFNPGEELTYSVAYGFVPAGSWWLRIEELGEFEGRPAYHFVSKVESNEGVSVIYEIEQSEEAWFDAAELYSLKYTRQSIENDTARDRVYRFDQEQHLRINGKGETKPASPRAVDQLSILYFIRLLPFEPGAKFTLRNLADPEDNPLTIQVLKKERVKVPAGTFETYVLKLDFKTNQGVFKKGGENLLWVTADDRHVPVKLSSRIGLGKFRAELVGFSAGKTIVSVD
ncbi:MAG: DUF3108 domain-containing protein [Gemmatimonadetes bacterium]|nr:DUF3108 domain-containing protein [Gemmatimonadota bacterium]